MFVRAKEHHKSLPWVEKYRPSSLENIEGQNWIVAALRNFATERKIPHMVFSGPAGTGKTSCAVAFVNDVLGDDFSADLILELNASDSVRMNTVRNEIKSFTTTQNITRSPNSLKFVILDEADNIPKDPQHALRRIIEKSPPNVRFILMCNYENRLIDPLLSRCALFRFILLPKSIVLQKLRQVANSEKIILPKNSIEIIYLISKGDLRKAINFLQIFSQLNIDDITGLYQIAGYFDPSNLSDYTNYVLNSEYINSVGVLHRDLHFSGRNFLYQLVDWVLSEESIPMKKKPNMLEGIAEIDFRLTLGSDRALQLESLTALLCDVIQEK